MRYAGQFLVPFTDMVAGLNWRGWIAAVVLAGFLGFLYKRLIRRLNPSITTTRFLAGLVAGGAMSVSSTLVLTLAAVTLIRLNPDLVPQFLQQDSRQRDPAPSPAVSDWPSAIERRHLLCAPPLSRDEIRRLADEAIKKSTNPSQVPLEEDRDLVPGKRRTVHPLFRQIRPITDIKQHLEAQRRALEAQRRAKDRSRSQSWTGLLQSLSHQPRGVQLLMLLLFVIACGYLSTMLPMGFLGLSLAMTAGVGWPEEICKAAAGTSLLYWMLPVKQESDMLFRRTVLSSYGIAGLGFGALEAIKYFGVYAVEEVGLSIYVVRAIWCVALHGAWTMLIGSIIWPRLPRQGKVFFTDGLTWHLLLVGTIPCAIAHGIYDACCVKESLQMLVVGVLSLGIALLVFARNCGNVEADCGVVA